MSLHGETDLYTMQETSCRFNDYGAVCEMPVGIATDTPCGVLMIFWIRLHTLSVFNSPFESYACEVLLE